MNIHWVYRPFLRYFRKRRMQRFWRRFGPSPEMRILDVGGDPFNWSLLPERPNLVIANLYARKDGDCWVVSDGRYLPFQDGAFDIVYSNSVIEHVGEAKDQHLFAAECRRCGVQYYVQTPNRRFPMEPHLLTPFIHWLPRPLQRRLLRNATVWGWITRPTQAQCDRFVEEVHLLGQRELQELFPDAEIWRERFLGLVKSLIAVRCFGEDRGSVVSGSAETSGEPQVAQPLEQRSQQ